MEGANPPTSGLLGCRFKYFPSGITPDWLNLTSTQEDSERNRGLVKKNRRFQVVVDVSQRLQRFRGKQREKEREGQRGRGAATAETALFATTLADRTE